MGIVSKPLYARCGHHVNNEQQQINNNKHCCHDSDDVVCARRTMFPHAAFPSILRLGQSQTLTPRQGYKLAAKK